ncbi:MAG: SRPBCC family protein [Gemmataceae bacterium]|nr:SRPBCC family protein [Gemmataceae bacterium]
MSARTLSVTASGDREVVIARAFDAPRERVWAAYTTPGLLRRWLSGLPGWSLAVCEIDLRPGGKYRYVWRGPDEAEMGMGGVYREVAPPDRLVATERFDQAWYPGEGLFTLVLTEEGGVTRLTQTMRYESTEARDAVLKSPMEQGLAMGFDRLAGMLAAD